MKNHFFVSHLVPACWLLTRDVLHSCQTVFDCGNSGELDKKKKRMNWLPINIFCLYKTLINKNEYAATFILVFHCCQEIVCSSERTMLIENIVCFFFSFFLSPSGNSWGLLKQRCCLPQGVQIAAQAEEQWGFIKKQPLKLQIPTVSNELVYQCDTWETFFGSLSR